MGQRHDRSMKKAKQKMNEDTESAVVALGQRHDRKIERQAAPWMLETLAHHVAVGSSRLAYGVTELHSAANQGSVSVLLVGDRHLAANRKQLTSECQELSEMVLAHGGRVIVVPGECHELEMLGVAALCRHDLFEVDEYSQSSSPPAKKQKSWGEASLAAALPSVSPPSPLRTLTDVAGPSAPVEPIDETPSASLADELSLLNSMFGGERKYLRQLAPFDGSHFVLFVECETASAWLILEFAVPSAYPDVPPVVTAPYGQVGERALSVDETAAAAASCCASVADELGGPVIYSVYDAARVWLLERHTAA